LLFTKPLFVDLFYLASSFEIFLLQLNETKTIKFRIMKTKTGIFVLCLLLVCMFTSAKENGTALLSGQSLTQLGQYSIRTSTEMLKIGDEALKTYELSYSNSDSPVLIGVKKTKKCMNFIIRSQNFEVEYVCNKHVFGVKRINKEYQTVPSAMINKMMDNADFYTQRVISQIPKTEEELLGLIACYFPSLIKDDYLADL
jgi:hypothetical protein